MGYLRLYILFLPHVPSLSSSPLPSSSSPQSAHSRPITSHWHCLQRRYRVNRHHRLQPLHSKTKPRSVVSICVWLPLAWRPVSDVPRGGWPVLEVRPALSYLASTDLLCSNSRVCLAYPGLLGTIKLSMNSLSASSWTWTLHKNCHSLTGIPCFLQLAEQWALFIYRPSVDPTLSPSVLQASTTPGTHIHLVLGVFECLKPRLRIPIGYWSVPLPPSSTLQYRGMATPPSPQLGQKVLHLCHHGHTEWLWQFWWTNIYSPLWALNVTRILDIH